MSGNSKPDKKPRRSIESRNILEMIEQFYRDRDELLLLMKDFIDEMNALKEETPIWEAIHQKMQKLEERITILEKKLSPNR